MYDEERNAERCVLGISEALRRLEPHGRLIVVDDGSKDGTRQLLRGLSARLPQLVVVEHAANAGYGAALVTGIREAARRGAGYVLFMDADLTTDPCYIPSFVDRMREDVDVIKATRYASGGGMRGVPAHRVLISRLGNLVARALFRLPLTDVTNGFRAVKVDLLAGIPFQERAFAVIMEELYWLSGSAKTFAEVPYILTSRGTDQGVSRFVYRPKVFLQYLKYAALAFLRSPRLQETQ